VSPLPPGVRAVLLDIEGTTTPLTFVTEVLFPYARVNVRAYLERHAAADDHARLFESLAREHHAADSRGDVPPPWVDSSPSLRSASAAAFADWLMDRDSKSTPLKELQGLLWEQGYRTGALVGEVFPDVATALRRWRANGVSASVYSSGSVLAQQLLFQHSSAGDLTPLLHRHFDTTVGAKRDAESYRRIARLLERPADAMLFLSDVPGELDAAREAGLATCLVVRPGNAPVTEPERYLVVRSFDDL
jgi:enolase-phosphatase E1